MAYQGRVEFLDVLSGKVKWNEDIQLPFEDGSTRDRSTAEFIALRAKAYSLPYDVADDVVIKINFDSVVPLKQNIRCVAIGTEDGNESNEYLRKHYVLIIDRSKGDELVFMETVGWPVCRRTGVGVLLEEEIMWEHSIPVKIV